MPLACVAMVFVQNFVWVSRRQSRSLIVGRKRTMLSSVASVMPSPSSGHGAAIVGLVAATQSPICGRQEIGIVIWV